MELLIPDWRAPARVRAVSTTRTGGVSLGRFAASSGGGLNLGANGNDDPAAVRENRSRLARRIDVEPRWTRQVHWTNTIRWTSSAPSGTVPEADSAWTTEPGVACAVTTADCLPVLLTDSRGSVVAGIHAGWRGLAAGIIERTMEAIQAELPDTSGWMAWIGPAIGPSAFEVGRDVLDAFVASDPDAESCFVPKAPDATGRAKWMADLPGLARRRLGSVGVKQVHGGGLCTFGDSQRFYSHRRDGVTGRMATLIWLVDERN